MNIGEKNIPFAKGVPLPELTVMTVTCRTQYMPLQANALKLQTFKDFEWLVVDDFCEKNRESLTKYVDNKYPLIHVSPAEIKPYFATASAYNSTFRYVNGELILFLVDYVVPSPTCLERHWEVHLKYPKAMISGRTMQLVKEGLHKVGGDYRLWLFEKGFCKRTQLEENLYEVKRDSIQNWWMGRNDSAPLQPILDCNGLDENFDGRWGGQDADLANRLMTYGLGYILDTDDRSLCLEYPHVHGAKPAIKSEKEQQDIQDVINKRVDNGIYWIENGIKKENK